MEKLSRPAHEPPEAWNDSPSQPSERTSPAESALGHGLLASRTWRQYISVAEAMQFMVLCYGSPSKLIHHACENPERKHLFESVRFQRARVAAMEQGAGAVLVMDP